MQYQEVTEQQMWFDLPDSGGLQIKGSLRGTYQQPLVVLMHGRFTTMNSLLSYLGARYLHEHGFAVLRLEMYGYGKRVRDQFDCTLDTHVIDFEAVIAQLRSQDVKTIYGAGHSYGGLTILKAAAELDGVVLWDPSHGLTWQKPLADKWYAHSRSRTIDDMYVTLDAQGCVISQAANEYDLALGDTTDWAANKGYPLKVINADRSIGILTELGKQYIAAADGPKQHVEITGSGHGFTESDAIMMRLFEETASWFESIENGGKPRAKKEHHAGS